MDHWSNDTMSFGDTFRAIRGGDIGCIMAFTLEVGIMLSPVLILGGMYLFT